MKVRQAFVANSSSSSFLIGVHNIPTTVDEGRKEFFCHGGEFVCDAVVQHMIEGMKPYKLDLDLLLEIAKTRKWKDVHNYSDDRKPEEEILSNLAQDFEISERYHTFAGGGSMWSSNDLKPMEEWTRAEEDKLVKKLGLAKSWDIPWKERQKIENRWFDKKATKQAFISQVEWFCNDFRKYEILMYGEFSDDYTLGSEVEHGGHWDKVLDYKRFSHH